MSQRFSFVIPVLNEERRVAPLLEDLRRRFPAAELLVVDGGSIDGTVKSAMPLADQLLLTSPGRAGQMNLGGHVARGDYIFFLHADSSISLDAGSLESVLTDDVEWGFCRVRLSGEAFSFRVIERCMNWRSRLTHIATGDQALFVCRDLFRRDGGFADIPLMEDVEYCKRLRKASPPLILQQPVTTSSRRWERRGILRTVLLMWWLRLAFVLGVPPARLHRAYYGG